MNQSGFAAKLTITLLVLGVWNVNRFRGGLAFKAHRRVYHSTLGLRVIKKKREVWGARCGVGQQQGCASIGQPGSAYQNQRDPTGEPG